MNKKKLEFPKFRSCNLNNEKEALKVPEKFGLEFTEELQTEYEDAIAAFLCIKLSDNKKHSLGKIKELLKHLEKASENFITAIKMFDYTECGWCLYRDSEDKPILRRSMREKAIKSAEKYRDQALMRRTAMAFDKAKGTRRPDLITLELIERLIEIYEAAGQSVTTSGSTETKFVKFARIVFETLGHPYQSPEALNKAVERRLIERKKKNSP